MRRTITMGVLMLAALQFLPGCYFAAGFGKAPWNKPQPLPVAGVPKGQLKEPVDSPVRGEWSEPVNGIRMAVKQIRSNEASETLTLLILIENVSDQSVDWPGIAAEHMVFDASEPGRQRKQASGTNLRITIEPLDEGLRAKRHVVEWLSKDEQEIHAPIKPHEIRMHAVVLKDMEQLKLAMQQSRAWDTIEAESVLWPDMSDPGNAGRYRIHLTYRPDGVFPGTEHDEHAQQLDSPLWKGKQIDLPPIEIKWDPSGEGISEKLEAL